jgi:hypothetical protein
MQFQPWKLDWIRVVWAFVQVTGWEGPVPKCTHPTSQSYTYSETEGVFGEKETWNHATEIFSHKTYGVTPSFSLDNSRGSHCIHQNFIKMFVTSTTSGIEWSHQIDSRTIYISKVTMLLIQTFTTLKKAWLGMLFNLSASSKIVHCPIYNIIVIFSTADCVMSFLEKEVCDM